MRIVHGQQAKRNLKLSGFDIGSRAGVGIHRKPVHKIRFPDLKIFAVRNIRRVLRNQLQKQVAGSDTFADNRVLNVQFRRVDPNAALPPGICRAGAGIQRAADQKAASQRNGIGQGNFGGRLIGGGRQGRRRGEGKGRRRYLAERGQRQQGQAKGQQEPGQGGREEHGFS